MTNGEVNPTLRKRESNVTRSVKKKSTKTKGKNKEIRTLKKEAKPLQGIQTMKYQPTNHRLEL